MRSILRGRPILGDELLDAFRRSLGERDLSPVTARGYLHDLGRLRAWLEGEAGGKSRNLRRITAVDLASYRQRLLGTERLQVATINRKLQAIKTLFGWALDKGLVKENVARVVRFVRVAERLCPKGLTEAEVQSLLRVYRTSLRPVPFTGY
jgi:site-specific recombinase XerD